MTAELFKKFDLYNVTKNLVVKAADFSYYDA